MLRLVHGLFAIALLGACARDPAPVPVPAPSAPAASSSASPAKRRDLARVEVGMSEARVIELLGPADEVRRENGARPWIVGASAAWAYGVTAPGTFAFAGEVLFDASGVVMMVRSPVDALGVRARRLRWSDTAAVDERGLSCHLAVIRADPRGVDAVVTLKNDGASALERSHGHTGITFDLVVELFDDHKRLLGRYDTLSLFSPYAPGDTAVMRIPAQGSISEKVRLGQPWSDLGELPKGRYFLRVAFPFEVGRFSPSAPVRFEI